MALTTTETAEKKRLLDEYGRIFWYGDPSEERFAPLGGLTVETAATVWAIQYRDGGIDCANDYIRRQIIENVRRINAANAIHRSDTV